MIEIVTLEEKFKELEINWDSLYINAISRTPFQSFIFSWSSWSHFLKSDYRNKLWLVSIYDNNRSSLEGIIPLYIDKNAQLRFINDLHADFCDGLFHVKANIHSIAKNLIEIIKNDKQIKSLHLSNFTDQSILLPLLYSYLNSAFVYSYTVHSFLPKIEQDRIENSNHLKSKERNELKKANRINNHFEFISFNNKINQYPADAISEIKTKMIKNKSRSKSFFGKDLFNLSKDLFDHGLLCVDIMKQDNVNHAASMIISDEENNWSMFWIVLFNNIQLINIASYNKHINSQLKLNKNSIIDFGRGGYNSKLRNYLPIVKNVYKLEWGKSLISILNIYFRINMIYTKKLAKQIIKKI